MKKISSDKVKTFAITIFLAFVGKLNYAQNWSQVNKIISSDHVEEDRFGYSVAISGDFAMVGTFFHEKDTNRLNHLSGAGAVYVLKNISGVWTEVQKLVNSDRGEGDLFGYSLAMIGDYAIIGAPGQKFELDNEISLYQSGAAYVFKNVNGKWTEIEKLVASDRGRDAWFGKSISVDSQHAIIGAHRDSKDSTVGNDKQNAGSAYIFRNNNGSWSEIQKLVASDREAKDLFGSSVSISGTYAIVGAPEDGKDENGNYTGFHAGSAYIFKNTNGLWSEVHKVVGSDRFATDYFGYSVAIDAEYAIIGAYGNDLDPNGENSAGASGSAFVFKNNNGVWSEIQKLAASDRAEGNYFGYSVYLKGDYAIIAAIYNDKDTSGTDTKNASGSAYIFKNVDGFWVENQKIVASDRERGDQFGVSVSITEEYAIVGANLKHLDRENQRIKHRVGAAYIFINQDYVNSLDAELSKSYSIHVYPNPACNTLNIANENLKISNVIVKNLQGTTLLEHKGILNRVSFDISALAVGVYVIQSEVGGVKVNHKFIKY